MQLLLGSSVVIVYWCCFGCFILTLVCFLLTCQCNNCLVCCFVCCNVVRMFFPAWFLVVCFVFGVGCTCCFINAFSLFAAFVVALLVAVLLLYCWVWVISLRRPAAPLQHFMFDGGWRCTRLAAFYCLRCLGFVLFVFVVRILVLFVFVLPPLFFRRFRWT